MNFCRKKRTQIFYLRLIFFSSLLFLNYAELHPALQNTLLFREIPPVELDSNQTKLFSLSPYLLNQLGTELKVQVYGEKFVSIQYLPKENALRLTPQKDWYGLARVNLKVSNPLDSVSLTLIIKVKKKSMTFFQFRPQTATKKVFLAGDFNSWNPNANPMGWSEQDQAFTLSLPLTGGRYSYKFVADGQWLPDPANPQKVSDGFGGYNSVIEVLSPAVPKLYGIEKKAIWQKDKAKGELHLLFGFDPAENQKSSLDPKSITILLNGKEVPSHSFTWSNEKQTIQANLANLPAGEYSVRVLAQDTKRNITDEIHFIETVGDVPKSFHWQDAVIYSIFTDRFFNGDKNNDAPIPDSQIPFQLNYQGGDWEGIIQKIKSGYFNELGVNVLWISPHNKNPEQGYPKNPGSRRKGTGYHGYWPISLTETEKRFGTLEKLKELVSLAHQQGIRILLDVVINHVHEEHPLIKENPKWFGYLELPDGRKNIQLYDERPLDTWFTEFMPDIDYQNQPEAVKAMVENTLWWIHQTGADGARLDAVKHVPMNFWKALRKAINEKIELPQGKIFYLLGETISSRSAIQEFLGDDLLHGQFDFPLYWAIRDVFAWEKSDFEVLETERKKSENAFAGKLMSPILGNHDFPRFISFADGSITPENESRSKEIGWQNPPQVKNALSYKKLKLAFAFLLTQPGIPTIYYGDEIGLAGAGDPDNRRMMKFEPNLTAEEKDLLAFVKKIVSIRHQQPALRWGKHKNLMVEKELYLFQKEFFQNKVVVGINRSKKPQIVEFGLPGAKRWKNLLDNSVVMVDAQGKLRYSIPPYEVALFVPL